MWLLMELVGNLFCVKYKEVDCIIVGVTAGIVKVMFLLLGMKWILVLKTWYSDQFQH